MFIHYIWIVFILAFEKEIIWLNVYWINIFVCWYNLENLHCAHLYFIILYSFVCILSIIFVFFIYILLLLLYQNFFAIIFQVVNFGTPGISFLFFCMCLKKILLCSRVIYGLDKSLVPAQFSLTFCSSFSISRALMNSGPHIASSILRRFTKTLSSVRTLLRGIDVAVAVTAFDAMARHKIIGWNTSMWTMEDWVSTIPTPRPPDQHVVPR